jgi:hypothetical protein
MAIMLPERRTGVAGFSGMKDPAQYRAFAEDCVRLAERAKSERERKILLEMAATWRILAAEADQQAGKNGKPGGPV